ncbi:MAG: hypothetical protein V1723_00370 [Candidatus Uhrbacteria bacterium]
MIAAAAFVGVIAAIAVGTAPEAPPTVCADALAATQFYSNDRTAVVAIKRVLKVNEFPLSEFCGGMLPDMKREQLVQEIDGLAKRVQEIAAAFPLCAKETDPKRMFALDRIGISYTAEGYSDAVRFIGPPHASDAPRCVPTIANDQLAFLGVMTTPEQLDTRLGMLRAFTIERFTIDALTITLRNAFNIPVAQEDATYVPTLPDPTVGADRRRAGATITVDLHFRSEEGGGGLSIAVPAVLVPAPPPTITIACGCAACRRAANKCGFELRLLDLGAGITWPTSGAIPTVIGPTPFAEAAIRISLWCRSVEIVPMIAAGPHLPELGGIEGGAVTGAGIGLRKRWDGAFGQPLLIWGLDAQWRYWNHLLGSGGMVAAGPTFGYRTHWGPIRRIEYRFEGLLPTSGTFPASFGLGHALVMSFDIGKNENDATSHH